MIHRVASGSCGDDNDKDDIKCSILSPHSMAESLVLIRLFLSSTSEAGAVNITRRDTLPRQGVYHFLKSHLWEMVEVGFKPRSFWLQELSYGDSIVCSVIGT